MPQILKVVVLNLAALAPVAALALLTQLPKLQSLLLRAPQGVPVIRTDGC